MTDVKLFDHYSFRARLQPAFLTLVPLVIGVLAWAQPGAKWVTALWSLLGAAGFTFFLANIARNRGKSIEPELWKSWGGAPTTQLLRHSGPANPVLRERWHKHLSKLLGKPFPTADEEQTSPTKADEIYEAATRLHIGKTRDAKKYPFVYRDNVNYGFCRNLYALRKVGISAAVMGFLVSLGAIGWVLKQGKMDYLPWGCAVVCAALLQWWIFTVNSEWVRVPAMNFALHLLDSTEKVGPAKKDSQAS